ncbi:MAG: AAA family ATPase [Bryobacteraceae bacterium]
MLLRFQFSNFRSFKDEQELSLVAESGSDSEAVFKSPAVSESILPVAALYGANASGKTNVLAALNFMASAVRDSHRLWSPSGGVPTEAFRLDSVSGKSLSLFAADFLIKDVRYQYGFTADTASIQEEWLFAYPNGKKQTWFQRKAGKPMVFSNRMPGENRAIENLTRPNSLFLSCAAQNAHEPVQPIYEWFGETLFFVTAERDELPDLTARLCGKPEFKDALSVMLKVADIGIAGLEMHDHHLVTINSKAVFANHKTRKQINLLHESGGGRNVQFALEQESNGTVTYMHLLAPILRAINNGGIICIDELDANLHPLLAVELIRLFDGPSRNPRGAQLIFTTQDATLLGSGLLRRDQIWFTEKRNDGASKLYPLTDFRPRKQENLQNGYLEGRYGAIPLMNADSFLEALRPIDAKER